MEARINDTLRRLAITRVIVAHRPETLRAADRVVTIGRRASGALPYPTMFPLAAEAAAHPGR
jgi:ATP-binding cassette subfamily B protein RaxB